MRIVCDSCGAVYKIADSKLVKEVNKATCKRCGHKIIIRKPRTAASVEGPSERTIISPGGPSAEQGAKKKKEEKTVITTIPELEKYESAAVSAGAIGSLTSELRTISAPADIPSPPATESLGPAEHSFTGFDRQSQVAEPAPMPAPPEMPPPPTPSPAAPDPSQGMSDVVTGPAMAPPPAAAPDPTPEQATQPGTVPPMPAEPAPPVAPDLDSAAISIAIPPESGPLFHEQDSPRDRLSAPPPERQPAPDHIHDADLSSAINQAPPVPPDPSALPATAGEVRTATREVAAAEYHPKGELIWILLFSLLAMLGIALATLSLAVPRIPYLGTVGFGFIWTAALATFLTCIFSGFGRRKGRAVIMAFLGLILGMGLAFGLTAATRIAQTEFSTQLDSLVGTTPTTGTPTTGTPTPAPIDETIQTGAPATETGDGSAETGTTGTGEEPTPADAEDPTPDAGTETDAAATAETEEDEKPAIVFTSSPSRADVYMDDRKLGRTPYRYETGRAGRGYQVTMKKEGYKDTTVSRDFPRDGVAYARGTLKKDETELDAAAEDPTPEPEEDLPEYTDVLAPTIIEAIVGSNAAVKRCFAEAKARDEVVSGKIWVKFTVSPNGEVSKARITNTDLSGTDLDSCVSSQINRLQFAAFSGSTSKVVKYPFMVK